MRPKRGLWELVCGLHFYYLLKNPKNNKNKNPYILVPLVDLRGFGIGQDRRLDEV